MTVKKIISTLLSLALLASTPCLALSSRANQKANNPFMAEDRERNNIIAYATGEKSGGITKNTFSMGDNQRYIVTFKKDVPLTQIKTALTGYKYRLLADSSQRVFLVHTDESFWETHKNIILSFEEDSTKEVAEIIPNDTYATNYEYEMLNMFKAWDYGFGSKNIVIAVTDSGILRNHEDLKDANILEGYDFATSSTGVNSDTSGHGTKIIGLLSATPNNGKGACGIAPECTILPLKITSENGKIYASDFLDSVYMAADSGADIINMSLGGYKFLESEAKAMEYAYNKGCILIAASGNEGNDEEYAGMKCYPASYDGVISVGSVDSDGNSCVFSQHNDAVDISAPGKDLTLIDKTNGYITSSGTSFSTAFISGAAALALSELDGTAPMNSDAFNFLINQCAFGPSGNRFGAGILDVEKVISNVHSPLIWGVENGGVYYDNIKIHFNKGEATLDGETFNSGELCKHTGNHTLTVTDGNKTTEIKFTTDNLPLEYKLKNGNGYSYIEFSYGKATLNGLPYKSGEKITTEGKHTLVLTSPYGNKETFQFNLSFSEVAIYGVENGEKYNHPVNISIPSGGTIKLDDKKIDSSRFTVSENGTHTITVSQNGGKKTTVTFEINYNQQTINTSVSDAKAISEFGVVVVWNNINRGVRLYDSETLKLIKYVNLGENITNACFINQKLYVAGTNNLYTFKGEELKNNATASAVYTFEFPITVSTFDSDALYSVQSSSVNSGKITKLTLSSLEEQEICTLKNIPDIISYDSVTNCIAFGKKEESKFYISYADGSVMKTFHTDDTLENGFIFKNGKLAYGGKIFSIEKQKLIFYVADSKAIYFDGTKLITENGIYNTETFENQGLFAFPLENLAFCNGIYYASVDNSYLYVSQLLPSAICFNVLGNCGANGTFGTNVSLSTKATSVVSINNNLFFTDNSNTLYSVDKTNFSLTSHVFLPFVPSGMKAFDDSLYIYSDKISYILIYNTISGKMVLFETPSPISMLDAGKNMFAYIADSALYVYSTDYRKLFSDNAKKYHSAIFSKDGQFIHTLFERSFYTILECRSTDGFSQRYEKILNYEALDMFCDDIYLYINTAVYNIADGSVASSMTSKVYGRNGNTFITATGLFENGKNKSYIDLSSDIYHLDKNGDLYIFEGNSLSITQNTYGIYNINPNVVGVENGGIYSSSVSFTFSSGVAYLDGVKIDEGKTVSTGGEHTLLIAFPFGLIYKYNFTVNASLNEIRIKGGDVALRVNGETKLYVEFFPIGAPATDIMFYCESDVASVSSDGVLKGLKPGEATVFAATLDGVYVTSVKVVVKASVLEFTHSYYGINLTDGILYGVPSGTTVQAFFNSLTSESKKHTKLFDTSKNDVTEGIIKTGMEICLLNQKGEVLDSLIIAVTGDCNGDGDIDIGDLVSASNMINNQSVNKVFVYGADFSNNGIVDVADIFTYKEILSGNENTVSVAGTTKPISDAGIILSCSESNGTFTLTIRSEEPILGISGIITYSKSEIEFVSAEKTGTVYGTEETEKGIRFFSSFSAPTSENLTTITFKAKTEGTKVFCIEEVLIYLNETKSTENISLSYTPGLEPSGDGNKKIYPSSGILIPEFSPNVFSYALKVPYGTESVEFSGTFTELIVIGNHNLKDGSVITIKTPESEYKFTIVYETNENNGISLAIIIPIAVIFLLVVGILTYITLKKKNGEFLSKK